MDLKDIREALRDMYGGENKPITDGRYDPSLAVKCINGTFVGMKRENIIAYRGIPYVGKQPVGELRWKAPVDAAPDDEWRALLQYIADSYREDATDEEAARQWQEAEAQIRGYAEGERVALLSRDTQLHLVIVQFRGPRLLRLDDIEQ